LGLEREPRPELERSCSSGRVRQTEVARAERCTEAREPVTVGGIEGLGIEGPCQLLGQLGLLGQLNIFRQYREVAQVGIRRLRIAKAAVARGSESGEIETVAGRWVEIVI
jgi:hypothetical protein